MLTLLLLACAPPELADLGEASTKSDTAAWSPCASDPCTVMPLGDSITDGYNVPGGYRILLEELVDTDGHSVDFVGSLSNGPAALADQDHEGHSGWRIDQIQRVIVPRMLTYDPDVVLLHIGTNDIFQSYALPTASNRLSRLVTTITTLNPDALVLVATIVPASDGFFESRVVRYNTQVEAVVDALAASGLHVELVDQHAALTASDLADGVHPNATGYDKMAEAWYLALEPYLP